MRPARYHRTPLEYGLMCLIARAPMTGSQLVTLLRRYPLAGTGKSPGAVYPALYRLEEAGLVCARTRRTSHVRALYAARRGGPGREGPREFGLTGEGVIRLRRWATRRVTRTEVLERPEHLLLRFAMCTGLAGPTAARRVALQCRRVCAELARELAEDIDRLRGTASPSARLALECTLALIEARVAWSRRAEVELARHAVREPELDAPPAARQVMAVLDRLPARIRDQLRWPWRDGPPPKPPPKPPPRSASRSTSRSASRSASRSNPASGPGSPGIPDWEDLRKLRRRFARGPVDARPP
jgi:DNA-binding PadR family transcriptional regulator